MDRPCIKCGVRDATRGRRAYYCSTCVATLTCTKCAGPLDRKPGAKYCSTCRNAMNPYEYSNPNGYQRIQGPRMDWDADSYLGLNPSPVDWARLAAYVDGEGSINLTPRATDTGNSLTLCGRVVVTNTDMRLPLWCHKTFGMNINGKEHYPGKRAGREINWKSCYYAVANGFRAAWILRNCLPWFLMKADQAQLVVEHQQSSSPDLFRRGSGVKTPQNILEYRMALKQK